MSEETKQTHEETFSFLKRNFNALSDQNVTKRKEAITAIQDRLKEIKHEANQNFFEQVLAEFDKALFKSFSDSSDKVRETSIKIFQELISRCQDLTPYLKFTLSIVANRVNCQDLEGMQHLPEIMRPPPSQKPTVLIKLLEPVEEIRCELAEIINIIICCCNEDELRDHIDDIVNILRALAMDPSGEVQIKACQILSQFSRTFTALLHHFTVIMARGVLLPLVSKKSKVKIAAMHALGNILYCGAWKYTVDVMEVLVGHRDPNVVPLKDFFGEGSRINYLAILTKDPKSSVREVFIQLLGNWLISLPDRWDHHPRLIPYLITGLFDPDDEVRMATSEIIEELGLQYEKEKEKDLREARQFGFDAEWTYGGKFTSVPLFEPFKKRPRLGARYCIRAQSSKMLNALYREIRDWQFESRLQAVNLLLVQLIYTEDFITQFIDKFFTNLLFTLNEKTKEDQIIFDKAKKIYFYIGFYCSYKSYYPILESILKKELAQNVETVNNSIKALCFLLEGFFAVTVPEIGLVERKEFLVKILSLLEDSNLLALLDNENCSYFCQAAEILVRGLLEKAKKEELEEFFNKYGFQLYKMGLTATGHEYYEKLRKDLYPELKNNLASVPFELYKKSPALGRLSELQDIFEDKSTFSFVDTYFGSLTSYDLTLLDWKVLSGAFVYCHRLKAEKKEKFLNEVSTMTFIVQDANPLQSSKTNDLLFWTISVAKILVDQGCIQASERVLSNLTGLVYQITGVFAEKYDRLLSQFSILNLLLRTFYEGFGSQDNMREIFSRLKKDESSLKRFTDAWGAFLYQVLTILQKSEKQMQSYKDAIEALKGAMVITRELYPILSQPLADKAKAPVLPQIFDYALYLNEKFPATEHEKEALLAQSLLSELLELIPTSKNDVYNGHENLVKKYQTIIERLLAIIIDTKDSKHRMTYFNLLKNLSEKTPLNFVKELEKAAKHNQINRVELVNAIIKNALE